MRTLMLFTMIVSGFVIAQAKEPFSVDGTFVETCSCMPPCSCELTALESGCEGVGVWQFNGGTYKGQSLKGVKMFYAVEPASWVRLYIDAPKAQFKNVEAFARKVYAGYGKIEAVKPAKIAIAGSNGRFNVLVNGGKICSYETEPVIGGDGKTALTYSNIKNPINHTVMQAKCVKCTFSDGSRKFKLEKGRNAYFNAHVKNTGVL